jgi:hypothetical protein
MPSKQPNTMMMKKSNLPIYPFFTLEKEDEEKREEEDA